ncbi:MAG TPA: DNA ligase [Thermomonas sp.]|nr:DNA ligase [Thermomonas sp.]
MELRTTLLLALLPAIGLSAAAANGLHAPAPMLASRFDPTLHGVAGYLVSEKLDGVRARWDGQRLLTRSGHAIEVPAWFTAGWPRQPMDGELWTGRGEFQQVSDLVRAHHADPARWRQVRFLAFDLPADGGGFARRSTRLRSLVLAADTDSLGVIAQLPVRDRAALEARLEAVVAAGGEGLMLHRADARYRAGRSDALLKFKPFDDAEARVVGYRPGKGKYAGMVGALLVEDARGRRFALGSGLRDADRARPPRIGAQVTFRYNGLTAKGTPRFARYLRVRHDLESASR